MKQQKLVIDTGMNRFVRDVNRLMVEGWVVVPGTSQMIIHNRRDEINKITGNPILTKEERYSIILEKQ